MSKHRTTASWRLRSSFISSIISTTLVLYALGMLVLLLVNVQRVSQFVKETLSFSVILVEDVRPVDAEFLRKTLSARSYVKETKYISKERAAEELTEALGADFLDLLQYNPLKPSIELKLRAPWANNDSIRKIGRSLLDSPQVADIHYEPSMVSLVNANVQRISLLILGFSLLMSFIALVLINNTIRISIYAHRFIIRTMQLVGATSSFIQRPFLLRAARHGLLASLLAIGLIVETVWVLQQEFYNLVNVHQYAMLGLVGVFTLVIGVVINVLTTYFAVSKYLHLSTDSLYY
ncbi:MAG: cell division protein FtsX [Bacteroidia bacterium]|nr:MAG: cell division protein FtsX [Bacteroidia bacterium]